MPRLHHLADARPFDFFDSFALRDKVDRPALQAGAIRLFGNCNIGIPERNNCFTGNQMSRDETSMIQNVYARTNFGAFFLGDNNEALFRAMNEFASAAQVTLVVGDQPQRQWPLSTLLGRKHGDRPVDEIPLGESEAYFTDFAKFLFRSLNKGADAAEDERIAAQVEHTWNAMIDSTRATWLNAAREAHRHLNAPQLVIVPPRQNYSVMVTVEHRSLGKLLEVLPDGIAPMPLVWVHLEGFQRRDAC